MALPTITFNSSGSDTAASGAGPATAVTGAGASLNSTTAVDLSADAPDLSGVATDGSAVLFVNTSSGQKYGKITGVDDGTKIVTVATAYSVTESGKAWAIGGKRATLDHADSRILLTTATGARAGWTLLFETDQTITSAIVGVAAGDSTSGYIRLVGASEHVLILQSANANHFSSAGVAQPTLWHVEKLKFANSNGTKTNAIAFNLAASTTRYVNCIFGDATNTLTTGIARSANTVNLDIDDCAFISCATAGVSNGSGSTSITRSYFKSCASGFLGSSAQTILCDNLFVSCATDGARFSAIGDTTLITVERNTFYGCGDGLDTSVGLASRLHVVNNNFVSNTTGWRGASGQDGTNFTGRVECNNYHSNTNAHVNSPTGSSDVALDPQFTNAAGFDFSVGANLKAIGFPIAASRYMGANQSATRTYQDIGPAQRQEAGSGGGPPANLLGGIFQ